MYTVELYSFFEDCQNFASLDHPDLSFLDTTTNVWTNC